ncbi:GMC oxidoreductase-domain-containing protein [Pterulicium gracile]|uniref:GMC oxidoreductase-domain-containing protein n=1 Tax=Pterulicium gracile TaxID=1884261 RepID=A0A5C3Q9X1_9AGAR|nr:GMC oxidoreductase-domain-containing protein [Pterula gracilis]
MKFLAFLLAAVTAAASANAASDYDLIFVGGGFAACVTATRLATADPKLKILIVESGPHTETLEQSIIPGLFLSHMAPGSTTQKFHFSNPADYLGGRVARVPTGHAVGGGSAVNSMIYARASASDFDEWKNVHQNPGWGASDLAPLMRKLETYQPNPSSPTHGNTGAMKGSIGNTTLYGLQALEVAKQYDTRGSAADTNDLKTIDKWVLWPKWIDETTGRRSDAARDYLYPLLKKNKNVVLTVESDVNRVLFNGTRATGIEYTHAGETLTANASKLVVVSAGTLGSSAVLERSGVGSPTILKAAGVDVVVDLAGVGSDYQDHQFLAQGTYLDNSTVTLDFAHAGDMAQIGAAMQEWHATGGKGILATNGIDTGIKYKPSAVEVKTLSTSFQKFFAEKFASKADKALVWFAASAGLLGPHDGFPPNTKLGTWGAMLLYPESHGHVHIRSKNVSDPLDFDCGFVRSPLDLEALRFSYKRTREHARRHPLYRGEVAQIHPAFPAGSKAAVALPPQTPVAIKAADLVYTAADDAAIDKFIAATVSTTWHSMSTNAMKPRANGGVVDPSLNVYGTKNLKVADLSISPSNIGANSGATAGLIGEKAAVIIAKELGIQGV